MPSKSDGKNSESNKLDAAILTIQETFDMVQSSSEGLDSQESKLRLSKYGKNELAEKKQDSKLRIFLSNFNSPLIYALFGAAVLAIILGKKIDAIVIFAVILINAVIGYVQETKAKKDIDALKKLSVFKVRVIREGKQTSIDSAFLVPGDVVVLEEGLRVPADGRLFDVNNLLINESTLTGESELIAKADEKLTSISQITNRNMVYQGTVVAEGSGKFVVLSTGGNTKFGKIALYAQDSQIETPIQIKIRKLSQQIGVAVLAISVVVFGIGVLVGHGVVDMIQLSVSLAVSAIPEGLPIAVTIVLVLGAKRMAKRKAIVRNMLAVETLGTTTVIATDKTGTLTHNKLKVTDIYTDTEYRFEPDNKGGSFVKKGKKYFDHKIEKLVRGGGICNDADLDQAKGQIIGEPTDAAVLENAMMCGIVKRNYQRLDELPFTSQKRFMATLNSIDGKKVILIKGAPEEVLKKCGYYLSGKQKLTADVRKKIKTQITDMSQCGLRVVMIAEKNFTKNFSRSLSGGFTYLGLVGMKDTYRSGVKEAIQKCKEAGIRIVMLTGDHLDTATAIAKKLGIIENENEAIVAQNYYETSPKKRDLENISVFARILPELKYKIINDLKKKGEIVAMTGDGVNDVPALRKADIGVAMGISGTDAAKEAADIVLADDNFATIVSAVEEGRTIFANLRKTLLYLISTSVGEVLTVLGSLILSLPLPITPLQILWINLITDTSATIPLGVEPKEGDHLKVPPRDPREGLLSPLIVRRSLLVGLYMGVVGIIIFTTSLPSGIDYARTVTFLFLTISQWVNAFNCRSEKKSVFGFNPFSNIALVIGIAVSVILQIIVMYLPMMEKVFKFVPVGMTEWGFAIFASLGILLLIEIDKVISNRVRARR